MGGSSANISAERIGNVQLQQSSYGNPVAIVYGAARVPLNLCWYDDFKATKHTESQGGKGGGGVDSTTYSYTAAVLMAVCEGPITGIGTVWLDKDVTSLAALSLTLKTGAEAQAVWSYLTYYHAAEAIGYSGTAYLCSPTYALDSSAGLPNHNVEVLTGYSYSGSNLDALPAIFIPDFLSNPRYGCGFPLANLADLGDYSDYCRAAGFFLSPVCSDAQEAQAYLSKWVKLTNSELVWSGDQLKIVPYGDEALTGNGATYTPTLTPIYDLDDDDFLEDDEPLTFKRGDPADAWNALQLKFSDRTNDYNTSVVSASDQLSIELNGLRQGDDIDAAEICDAEVAGRVLQAKLQRNINVRNQYQFKLGAWAALIEPMDRLTITVPALGLDRWPVLVVSIEDTDDDEFDLVVEDSPTGIRTPALYERGAGAGYAPNTLVDPGDVAAPLIFEPPLQLTGGGLQVWAAVTGSTSNWGGCTVWVSTDGASYRRAGTIEGGSRYGTLNGAISDTATDLSVQLAGIGGELLSGSALDAELLNTLCAVDSEFFTYQGATLTGPNEYTLDTLSRGAYGSTVTAHADGAGFVRMDADLAKSETLTDAFIGQTIYFKFTSRNIYGRAEQALEDVDAYGYEITGHFFLAPPGGLSDVQLIADTSAGLALFSWDSISNPDLLDGSGRVVIRYYDGDIADADWDDAVEVIRVPATDVETTTPLLVGTYLLRTARVAAGADIYSSGVIAIANGDSADTTAAGFTIALSTNHLSKTIGAGATSGSTSAVSVSSFNAAAAVTLAWTMDAGGDSRINISNASGSVVTFSVTGLSGGEATATWTCTGSDGTDTDADSVVVRFASTA